jgi:uncharacterized protein YdhG (YjbR/CyaY superfamily)
MAVAPANVDAYIASFTPEVQPVLQSVREAIHSGVPGGEEKIRYGMAAVMLGGRYAIHFAGWKHHVGLYPIPEFEGELESDVAPYRAAKDSVNFAYTKPVPFDLITRMAAEIVRLRGEASAH